MGKNSRIKALRSKIRKQSKQEDEPTAQIAAKVFASKPQNKKNKDAPWYKSLLSAAKYFLKNK